MDKMNGIYIVIVSFCVTNFALAQNPVNWEYSIRKIGDQIFELHLNASIKDGWHIYAQVQPRDAISIPTRIRFTSNPLIALIGHTKEKGNLQKQVIKELKIEQYDYAENVEFVQLIKLKAKVKTNVNGTVAYQVCTDDQCMPVKEEAFSLNVE